MARRPCAALWETPAVNHNGDVTTCCLDVRMVNCLGNLTTTTLLAIWRGPTIHAWRLAQIRGDFAASGPACPGCNYESAGYYPTEKVRDYLERTGEAQTLADLIAAGPAEDEA